MEKFTTVMLCGREDVIGQGVEIFLKDQGNCRVTRIIGENYADVLAKEIEKLNPDVVILNSTSCANDQHLPLQLIKDHPGIKVITLNLASSSAEVYDQKKVWIKQVNDLLDIITNDSFPQI